MPGKNFTFLCDEEGEPDFFIGISSDTEDSLLAKLFECDVFDETTADYQQTLLADIKERPTGTLGIPMISALFEEERKYVQKKIILNYRVDEKTCGKFDLPEVKKTQ